MTNQQSATDKKVNKLINFLTKEYITLGKSRVRHWHAWLILSFVVGFISGIIFVANRSLNFETVRALSTIEETPWQTNVYGNLFTNQNWNYATGYHFTPQVNGQITALGGFFNGTKVVKLFDYSTGVLLASANVTATNTWSYTAIAPINLLAGKTYTVAVYLAGSGGSYRVSLSPVLPQTFGSIKIVSSTYAYTGSNPNSRPINTLTTNMYGQADIKFIPSIVYVPPPPLAYPYTKGLLNFPQDEGSHSSYNAEWWYSNFDVKDINQRNFRGFIALTRLNFTNTRPGLLIIGLTDVTNKIFWSKIYQGNIIASSSKMSLDFIDDASTTIVSWKQTPQPFTYELIVNSPEIKTNLITGSQKYPLAEQGSGFIRIGSGISSYYYSLTRMNVTAPSVTLNLNGYTFKYTGINGLAWFDHQWFNVPFSAIQSANTLKPQHEWFSIQLNDGTDLIGWKILSSGTTYSYLGFLKSNGSQVDTTLFNLNPLSYWIAPDGKKYADSWRLTSTANNLDLTIKTQVSNQQVRGVVKINGQNIDSTFYEGGALVSGVYNGISVSGSGYVELSKTY